MTIIGRVVFVGAIVVAAVGFLSALGIEVANLSDWAAFQNINWQELVTLDVLMPYIAVILGSLVVLFVFVVVTAIFLRKSLNLLSAKTGVNMFSTAGLIMLIGRCFDYYRCRFRTHLDCFNTPHCSILLDQDTICSACTNTRSRIASSSNTSTLHFFYDT